MMHRRSLGPLAAALAWPALARAHGQAADKPVISWPTVQLLGGGTWAPDTWQGRPAIVVIWATYCPYCMRHNARLDQLHRSASAHGVRILAVATDTDEAAVRRYMAEHGYSFPVTLDKGQLRQRLSTRRMIPLTALIQANGQLRMVIPGEMSEDDIMGLPRLLGIDTPRASPATTS